jgi:predicted house-cleaning NTP pyrophosphatase (Maf/HAM1 superfamily)
MAEDKPKSRLVLASASPRRLALLERVGIAPDLMCPADIDETPERFETPRRLAIRLAQEKAKAVVDLPLVKDLGPNVFVLAADTVVGLGRRSVPKAETEQDVKAALSLLSGPLALGLFGRLPDRSQGPPDLSLLRNQGALQAPLPRGHPRLHRQW